MDLVELYQRQLPDHAQELNRLAESIVSTKTTKGNTTALYAKAAHRITQLPKDLHEPARAFFQQRLEAFEAF